MRAYKRLRKGGFTLVELMIVVAIIGVLAALAIYGVRRYLASTKTSEAKNTIGGIARAAVAAWEKENTQSEFDATGGKLSAGTMHQLCGDSVAVPNAIPVGKKYLPATADGQDWQTGDNLNGWKCLRFGMTQPHYYQYKYTKGAQWAGTQAPATGFEAGAQGDLDGDGIPSKFSRVGGENKGEMAVNTQVEIIDEYE